MQPKNHRFLLFSLLLGMLVIAGCIPSLHPLYTGKEDLVWEPGLVGQWQDDSMIWMFSPLDPESEEPLAYKLIIVDDGKITGNLEARMVELGDQRFLDTFPSEPAGLGDYDKAHLAPVHHIWHVQSTSPTLHLRVIDPDWVEDFRKTNPGKIAVEELEEESMMVFTASSKDMQAFVLQHLEPGELFDEDGMEFKPVSTVKKSDIESNE